MKTVGYVWPNARADASSEWYFMSTTEYEQSHLSVREAPPQHFKPVVLLSEAEGEIKLLRTKLAKYEEEEARRQRERGDFWLTEEGRKQLKETFDDREDGNAVRPLLDRVEELERYLRASYESAFVNQVTGGLKS